MRNSDLYVSNKSEAFETKYHIMKKQHFDCVMKPMAEIYCYGIASHLDAFCSQYSIFTQRVERTTKTKQKRIP